MMMELNHYKRTIYLFVVCTLVASAFALEPPMIALAHHRDVGDGECSWFPDRVPPVYNFHEACTNHDACGERAGSNKLAWDRCDLQLKADARQWCKDHHSRWSPIRYSCLTVAEGMYRGLRAFVNGTRIHRN